MTALAASSDGAALVSGDRSGMLVRWDLDQVLPIAASWELAPAARDIALSERSAAALIAGDWTRLWPGNEGAAVLLPVGPTLAVSWRERVEADAGAPSDLAQFVLARGAIECWCIERREQLAVLEPPPALSGEEWSCATFAREGTVAALGARSGRVVVVHLREPSQPSQPAWSAEWRDLGLVTGDVRDVVLDPAGRAVAVVDGAGVLTTWEDLAGARWLKLVATEPGEGRNALTSVAFGRAGRWVLSGAESGSVMTWWRSTGDPGAELLKIWPHTTVIAVPPAGPPLIVGDAFGRLSVFATAAPKLAGGQPGAHPRRWAQALEDPAAILAQLRRAAEPDGPEALVEPAQAAIGALLRRQRFGRFELSPASRAEVDLLAARLAERSGSGAPGALPPLERGGGPEPTAAGQPPVWRPED
ncbi:MAG: hypothetical protein R3F49_15975 [Planctomycetota bacterium]